MNLPLSRKGAIRAAARAFALLGLCCPSTLRPLGQQPPSVNPSKRFGPDACGPADPSYIKAATETGGIPLFLQRSETAKSFQLVRESTRENVSTVLWATRSLDVEPQTIRIPVDSGTKRITFAFSVDTKGGKLELKQPSGEVIAEGSAGSEISELNCGRIMTVTSPASGNWIAEIAGKGRFWLEAKAQSDIYIIRAEFVRKAGRPGHEGLFPITGQPLAGAPATLEVSLSAAAAKSTEFHLVNEGGETIQNVPMRQVSFDPGFAEFVGSLEIPKVPFRVAVMGRDAHDSQYQRFFSPLFRTESVEVSPRLDSDELAPGSTEHVTFVVRNIGPPRTFKVTVTDAHQFVSNVGTKELSLGAGESGIVQVDMTVPAGTSPGGGDNVVFVATSSAEPATSNYCVVRFSVSSPTPEQNPR